VGIQTRTVQTNSKGIQELKFFGYKSYRRDPKANRYPKGNKTYNRIH